MQMRIEIWLGVIEVAMLHVGMVILLIVELYKLVRGALGK